MVATLKYCFYLCGVKINCAVRSRCQKQRFLCPKGSIKNKRKEWANSNVPKVFAQLNLTAPIALSLLSNFKLTVL